MLAEIYPVIIFFFGIALIFLLILLAFSRAGWHKFARMYPDKNFSKSYIKVKNVVRLIGTVEMRGKGGGKVNFTDAGLRISSLNPFMRTFMLPYNKLEIVKYYLFGRRYYIHCKSNDPVILEIVLPEKVKSVLEIFYGSIEKYKAEGPVYRTDFDVT